MVRSRHHRVRFERFRGEARGTARDAREVDVHRRVERVHARVRAGRPVREHTRRYGRVVVALLLAADESGERILDAALHGARLGLPLEPVEVGAVVLHAEQVPRGAGRRATGHRARRGGRVAGRGSGLLRGRTGGGAGGRAAARARDRRERSRGRAASSRPGRPPACTPGATGRCGPLGYPREGADDGDDARESVREYRRVRVYVGGWRERFTRKRDYEDTGAFTKNRMAPPRVHDRCSFLGDYDGVKLSQRHVPRNLGFCHILYDSTGS